MSAVENITRNLEEAKSKKHSVYLSSDSCDITFTSLILNYNTDHIQLKNTVALEYITQFMKGSQFSLNLGRILLQTDKITSNGKDIDFGLSEKTIIDETRQEKRLIVKEDENYYCEILNPYDQETTIKRRILDLSNQGMSISMLKASELFRTGTELPDIKIFNNGKQNRNVAGKVIYKRKLMNEKGRLRSQVGIQFI